MDEFKSLGSRLDREWCDAHIMSPIRTFLLFTSRHGRGMLPAFDVVFVPNLTVRVAAPDIVHVGPSAPSRKRALEPSQSDLNRLLNERSATEDPLYYEEPAVGGAPQISFATPSRGPGRGMHDKRFPRSLLCVTTTRTCAAPLSPLVRRVVLCPPFSSEGGILLLTSVRAAQISPATSLHPV